VENNSELIGVCGLYCGACYHYRASFPDGKYLLEEAVRQGTSLDGYICKGCRSEVLYLHPGCSQCAIRSCAKYQHLVHCGVCSKFPCDRIKAFQSDGRIHHLDIWVNLEELRKLVFEQWLAEQAKRWKCECGASFSWYEAVCNQCGSPLSSYASDLKDIG